MKNLFNYFKNGNYSRGIIIHLNISFPQNVKHWPFADHLGIKSHFGTGQTQTLRAGGAPHHGTTPAPLQPSCPERGQVGGTACSKLPPPPPANMGINTHKRALTTCSILKAQCLFFFPPNFFIIFFPPTSSSSRRGEETLLPTPLPPTPPFRLLPPALPAC